MTINELSKRYNIEIKKLKFFEKNNLIAIKDEFSDNDLKKISNLCILYDIGLDLESIKKLLSFNRNKEVNEQINLLSLYRNCLLDEIHRKQKSLDSLDYIIYEIKNKISLIF